MLLGSGRVGSGKTISGTGRVRASVLSPCRPLVCVCVCVCERERVCVCERERERESVCVCVYVYVRE